MVDVPWGKFPTQAADQEARRWLQFMANIGRAPNTIDAYGRAVEDHLRFCAAEGTEPLYAKADTVAAWIGEMLERPPGRPRGKGATTNLLKARGGRGYTLSLNGQEAVTDTAGVARMNLFMHNLTQFKVEVGDTLKDPRFKERDGSVKQFDVILANPPYSLKWKPWANDPRAIGGVAPQSSADWAFVQHMIASMNPKKGRAGVVLPHGVLFRGGQEAAIRQRVLDDDLLEAVIGLPANLFYSTSIPTAILVFRAPGTKVLERQDGVLFVDASTRFTKAKSRNVLTEPDVADTVAAYHSKIDADGNPVAPEGVTGLAIRFVPLAEIAANGYDLNIARYIKQAAAAQEDLGTLIDAYNIARANRQKTEARMLAVLAAAGIEGFDE